jgi:hypothetical protein
MTELCKNFPLDAPVMTATLPANKLVIVNYLPFIQSNLSIAIPDMLKR